MLARLLSPFKEFGVFPGFIYAVDRTLQRLSPHLRLQFYELLAQPIPDRPLLPAGLAAAFEMRQILAGAPEIDLMPARPDIKQSRFRQNAICLGTYQQDKLIGYSWLAFHAYQEDEVRCTFVLPEGNRAVFDFDLYLFPEHRMGLGFVAVWNGVNEFLRSRGVQFTFSRLTRFNLASRRAHLRLGARVIGRTFFLQMWDVEFMLATVAPFLHLSLYKNNRMRLKLHAPAGASPSRPVAAHPAIGAEKDPSAVGSA